MNKLVLTCEHGGNKIPNEYKEFFKNYSDLLSTHRGYDIGALELFRTLRSEADYSAYSETSRLFIELNRSRNNKSLFSSITKKLDVLTKKQIVNDHYSPYRNKVENTIASLISNRHRVIHISVHTFTPVLDNEIRNCDVGLLFDSRRRLEKNFCRLFKRNIKTIDSDLKVRFNYPYLGSADGFTSYLRKIFSIQDYLGIEIEVNNKHFINSNTLGREISGKLNISLSNCLKAFT